MICTPQLNENETNENLHFKDLCLIRNNIDKKCNPHHKTTHLKISRTARGQKKGMIDTVKSTIGG